MAGIQLSTAGVTLNYAVEATAGTRPSTGFKEIPEIKSIPELNPSPETIETTTLKETEFKTYIPGLKDLGGALSFTANLTESLMITWADIVGEYDTAAETQKSMWFCVLIPGLTKALYFTGQPSPIGMAAMEVSAGLETSLYVTPTNAPVWETKPTVTEASQFSAPMRSQTEPHNKPKETVGV